jgi:3D (Asp-Asp-Asp) domain-containing protein|tara:strand:- start:315 stop:818 length:504 start_codon:yes stop_codon:yes gene_type:complete
MNKYVYYVSLSLLTILYSAITTSLIDYKSDTHKKVIDRLVVENDSLKTKLSNIFEYGIEVDVTMYRPTREETDATPNITADGTKIKISEASRYRFVAVSRNLLKRWGGFLNYGDFVLLKDAGHKDGIYRVKDTMNARWVNVVDILESPGTDPYKFENANLTLLDWTK